MPVTNITNQSNNIANGTLSTKLDSNIYKLASQYTARVSAHTFYKKPADNLLLQGGTVTVPLNTDVVITTCTQYSGWYYVEEYRCWGKASNFTNIKLLGSFQGKSVSTTTTTAGSTSTTASEVGPETTTTASAMENANNDTTASTDDISLEYYEPDADSYGTTAAIQSNMNFTQIRGIYGMPYQYTESVDRRLSGMNYGWKFTEKIITKPPLLFLTPGRPQFMSGYSQKYKQNFIQNLIDKGTGADEAANLMDDKDGKYYTFKFAYDEYYKYVNVLCRNAANIMGIGDTKIQDGKGNYVALKNFDWSNMQTENLGSYISGKEYVCYYIDSDDQISQSFSNDTGDSSLASKVDSLSDIGKEVSFLLGTAAGSELEASIREGFSDKLEAFSNFSSKYSGPLATVSQRLFGGASALALGGHMVFPEIWKDSSYSASYDINIKLASPDGDNLSIYMNELVPYYHLLGFTLPQAMGLNAYTSPFLVRGSYGGFFNCEMGMITSMSVSKGSTWNANQLPLEMTISFTIKDLYQVLFMNNSDSATQFLKNSTYVDFIANSVGVNVNKPELLRTASLYSSFNTANLRNISNNLSNMFNNYMSNAVSKLKFIY